MKRKLYLIVLILIVFLIYVHSENWDWVVQEGTNGGEYYSGLFLDNSENIYVLGNSTGNFNGNLNNGGVDFFISKFSKNGTKAWTILHGTTSDDYGNDIIVDSSGNIYIVGNTYGDLDGFTNQGEADIILVKYDSSGNRIWTFQYGSTLTDAGCGIVLDNSDNIYITGYTYGDLDGNTNNGQVDTFISKFDSDGNKLWTIQPGDASFDFGGYIDLDLSGNIFVAGGVWGELHGNTHYGNFDLFLSKYDASGTRLWTNQYGTPDEEKGVSIDLDSNGNIYFGMDSTDDSILKIDTDGGLLWSTDVNTVSMSFLEDIYVDTNAAIYVLLNGYNLFGIPGTGSDDLYIGKYDSMGNFLWAGTIGEYGWDVSSKISVDDSGNIYINGYTYGSFPGYTNQGGADVFLTKLSKALNIRGYVKDNSGLGITEAEVTITGDIEYSYSTESDGYYEFFCSSGKSYTISPNLQDWSFSPNSYVYNILTSSLFNQDFIGTPVPITAPSSLSATPLSCTQIDLNWDDNSDNEQGFKINRKTTVSGIWSEIGTVGENVTEYSDSFDLNSGTEYYYRVYTFHTSTCSDYSNEANTFTHCTISGYVIDMKVLPLSGIQVDITGDTTASYITLTNGYYEFYNLPYGNSYFASAQHNDWSFSPDSYTYSILNGNQGNQNFTGLPVSLNSPNNLILVEQTDDHISFQWNDNSDNEDGFVIERKVGVGSWSILDYIGVNQTSYTDTDVVSSELYTYQVFAFHSAGRSYGSNELVVCTGFRISGNISDPQNTPIKGVTVKLQGAHDSSTKTDANGYYEFNDLEYGATYIIRPEKLKYDFDPERYISENLTSDETVNFTGYLNTLEYVKTYPVPWKSGSGVSYISFENLPKDCILEIYNISGELVYTTELPAGTFKWNRRKTSRGLVASGIYLYVIYNSNEKKTGKLVIIK